jgi:hypothetical protein
MIRAARRVHRLAIIPLVPLLAAAMTHVGAAQSPSIPASPTSGPAFDLVVSDDGRLTLQIPLGAAPPDVALSAVAVHTVVPSVAAYELRPVGVSFAAPVTATWTLDPAGAPPATDGDLIWLSMARADAIDGPWAWLDDARVEVMAGTYAVTGTLARFGTLVVTPLPSRIHGPEAVWGPGYEPGRGIPIDLDLTLVDLTGSPAAATFSGDWRFGGGYPDDISVTTTMAEADRLAAVWECLLPGATSLSTTFGVREDAADLGPTSRQLELGPAAAAFSVAFSVACGTMHPKPNG